MKRLGKPLTVTELKVCAALLASPGKLAVVAASIDMNTSMFAAHQNNLYAKLDVHSRHELAAKLQSSPRVEVLGGELAELLKTMNRKLDVIAERLPEKAAAR